MQPRLNLEPDSSVGTLTSVSALDSVTLPRHRWYFFKEAFSPEFVEHALEKSACGHNDLILDPFSGAGTTVLSSSFKNHPAVGVEVNPFLAFVSRTKLLNCKSTTFDKHFTDVLKGIRRGTFSPLENFSTFSSSGGAKKWLFNKEVLRAFEGGWESTAGMRDPSRSLLRLALICAAMDVCNAVKDGKCLRYRTGWEERQFGFADFLLAFELRANAIREDLKLDTIPNSEHHIYTGDARRLISKKLQDRTFSLCVMSPPYLNSFDYSDVYRPELFLGKFVETNKQLNRLRLQTLRSHVQVQWDAPQESDFGSNFTEILSEINKHKDALWHNRIPMMVHAYFEDLKKILAALHQRAANNASVWIVVSTSAYAGIEIPVDLIIADIGEQVGWYLREVTVVRYLRRVPGQQWDRLQERNGRKPRLRESVIILDKIPKR